MALGVADAGLHGDLDIVAVFFSADVDVARVLVAGEKVSCADVE